MINRQQSKLWIHNVTKFISNNRERKTVESDHNLISAQFSFTLSKTKEERVEAFNLRNEESLKIFKTNTEKGDELTKCFSNSRDIETQGNKSGLFSCPYRILDYFSDILFTFLTTFVLITKLKSVSVFLSVFLSVCLSVCLSMFLSFWHPVDILNNFYFDN